MKKLILFYLFITSAYSLFAQVNNWNDDATPLHRAQKALTDVIVHDVFSPPVASRIYLYTNIAAYEVLVKQHAGYVSLQNQIKSFPSIPAPQKKISSSLAAVYSFLLVGKKLVFSEPTLQDSLNNILHWYHDKKIDSSVYYNSLAYGKQVADSISKWMAKDKYAETRKIRRYTFSREEGKWIPTPPGYFAAVEPYWNQMRCITLDSASQFKPAPPPAFSKNSSSEFYKQAYDVYTVGSNLSTDEKEIASFWDCNPFDLNTQGHLNFASKKISPGGHWINIVAVVCKQTNSDIMKSSAAYTLTSIALFDAFISCWDEKYRSNLIRPETYINANIDENWRPFLQTPPFPEYISGHSIISTASAVVLTKIFGDNFSFDDDTENEFGLPTRHFTSFMNASDEAAISRFYGGIHYRIAIVNGQTQGREVGEWVLQKIHLQ